jgi:hypothetical protein
MKFQLTAHQYQKLQNMIYNVIKIRIRNPYKGGDVPMIVVEYFIQEKLDGLFGEGRWHEQLIKWIENNHPEVTTLYDKIKSVV